MLSFGRIAAEKNPIQLHNEIKVPKEIKTDIFVFFPLTNFVECLAKKEAKHHLIFLYTTLYIAGKQTHKSFWKKHFFAKSNATLPFKNR